MAILKLTISSHSLQTSSLVKSSMALYPNMKTTGKSEVLLVGIKVAFLLFALFFVTESAHSLTRQPDDDGNTIRKVWVDRGFFEWRTQENSPDIWVEGMVALKITELGILQENLPDVCDGEQLNSVHKMFEGGESFEDGTKLKQAPLFNTSNVVDFSYMFKDCFYIDSIPRYDTSQGENFHGMFYDCHSLRSIPFLETSKGTDFGSMFFKTSVKSIPLIDTSKGKDFSLMFADCFNLYSITSLNTSCGNNFNMMFQGCSSLKSVTLDVSNSAHFWIMFGKCYSLKEIKLTGLGKGRPSLPKYDFLYESNDIELPEDVDIESLEYIIDNGENLHSDIFYIRLYKKLESKISQSLIKEAENKNFTFKFRE